MEANGLDPVFESIFPASERVYQETLLKQQAELKSLRMQINPHFLYNT